MKEVESENVIAEYQYRVVMPHETYELVLPGSTDSVDGAPTKPVCVAVRLADDMRRAAAGLAPAYSDATGETVKIRAEEDLETRTQGQIVGCNPFRLAGSDLSASGEGEGIVGVSATGQKAEAEIVEENCRGAHVTARLVTALPPGKGTVMLSTRGWSTPEGELRTMSKSVTILAGATPPGPTPVGPTVTAINDGTFHAGAGNVITGANMRFADAFPGNHILIKDAQGTDMEAMISTDAEIPVTETRFALNLDEGQPLTDGEEYTFEFEMVDADNQPVTVTSKAHWQAE